MSDEQKRALKRFWRASVAGAVGWLLVFLAGNLTELHIDPALIPVLAAFIMGVAKYLRDRGIVTLPV